MFRMVALRFGVGGEFILKLAEKMERLLLNMFADLAWSKLLRSSSRCCGGRSDDTIAVRVGFPFRELNFQPVDLMQQL